MMTPMCDTRLSFPFNGLSAILGRAECVEFLVSGGLVSCYDMII